MSFLQAYALIAKGVRFVCTNTSGKNSRSVVLKTQGSDSLKDNIITVLGVNTFNCLEPVTLSISESCKVDGFLSKSGQGNGRNLGDRQYFFVNGRPVDMPKVGKLVNELYKSANSKQYPIAIMNFTVPTRAFDVNVTPDKRKIFFSEETALLQALREGLQEIYSSSDVCYSVNEIMQPAVNEDCVELRSTKRKSLVVEKPPSLNDNVPQEEHYSECKNGITSHDEYNANCNKDNVSHIGHKEKHITDSKNASESVNDDQCSHSEEGLIHENDGSLMGQEFTLRAHTTSKDYNCRRRLECASSLQGTLVSRAVESGGTSNQYSYSHSRHVQSTLNGFVSVNKRNRDSSITALSEVPVLRNQASHYQLKTAKTETRDLITRSSVNFDQVGGTSKLSKIESLQQLKPDNILHINEYSVPLRGDTTDRESEMVCGFTVKYSKN